MALQWKAVAPQDICFLSKTVINEQLAMASHLQLKVLLWYAANGCDTAACARALHKPESAVQEATLYWLQAGVLEGDKPYDAPTVQSFAPATETAAQTVDKPTPAARPHAVKPQMKEVVARQKKDREFAQLLQDACARFGRPITNGDMETLLYLYDTAGMPASVILMAIGYAVGRGSANMRYVETTVLNWQDSGIHTFAAAEEHLRLLEEMDRAAKHVQQLSGRARALDYRQSGMAHTWIYVWHFSDDIIRLALQTAAETTKPLIPYANAILAGWAENEIHDVDKAAATLQKQKPAARRRGQQEKTSLDLPAYEKMLETYVPTLPNAKE